VLITRQSSGIKYAQQLKGKRIAVESHAADIISYLNDEGVDLEDCDVLSHSFGVDQLVNKKVDAITAYISDEPYALANKNVEYNIISPTMGGIDFYGDLLFTSEEMIEKKPELVEKFVEASLKGWRYAMDNPEAIIQLIYSKYSQRHSMEHLAYEAEEMKSLILTDVVELGYTNPGRWRAIIDIYQNMGMLDSTITAEGLLYADYKSEEKQISMKVVYYLLGFVLLSYIISYFFYRSREKLKLEIARRKKSEEELQLSKEELKRLNHGKDRFYSIIAHDLRNPFNVILGFAELMVEKLDEENKEQRLRRLEAIRETAVQTSELLNNLLNWSSSQIGMIDYNPEIIDLKAFITNSIKYVRNQAQTKGINIRNDISENVKVLADPNMVNVVLQNLLTNAIKFTYPNGIIILESVTNNEFCEIQVTDNGVGIEKKHLEQLFSIENKQNKKGTAKEMGSGLGLLLCKEFVEMNKGEIWVESELGKGSSFNFSLPAIGK